MQMVTGCGGGFCRPPSFQSLCLRLCIIATNAPVAQLDRAIASGAIGREFESLRARQSLPATHAG